MEDNVIKVSVRPNKQNSVKVSSNVVSTPITANSDTSQLWSQVSKNWAVSENIVDNTDYSSKYYANKAKENATTAQGISESVKSDYNEFLTASLNANEQLQTGKEEALTSLESARADAENSINNTKTTAISDIEFIADGEKQEIEDLADLIKENAQEIASRTSFAMFDTVLKDHVLTYEESKGLALQGTYVYKEAIAGSRYGYPDFYNKCLEEYQNSSNEQAYLKSNVNYVGSVKDKQGVLSGFSTANYATLPSGFNPTSSDSWELVIEITTGNDITTDQGVFMPIGNGNDAINFWCYKNLCFYIKDSSNTDIATLTLLTGSLATNTTYKIKLTYSPTEGYKAYYKTNNDVDFVLGASSTKTTPIKTGVTYQFGTGRTVDRPFLGTINLNESYININGERWWSGVDTVTKNPNGHLFYDISQKDIVDEIFASTGMAWMYGIDQENERVFLPRNVWFEQMSMDDVGKAIQAGLPNHQHHEFSDQNNGTSSDNKYTQQLESGMQVTSMWYSGYAAYVLARTNSSANVGLSSNPIDQTIYGNSDTVQPNAVKKLLYICVGNTEATSTITDVVEVTTTENDTIPLGYSVYQANGQPSVSWLKSEGQWNDGNVYTTFYNEFVQKIGQAFASGLVVEYTSEYTDYDLVINQDDITFRLPLLDGSESIPDWKQIEELDISFKGESYIVPKSGYYLLGITKDSANKGAGITINGVRIERISITANWESGNATVFLNTGDEVASEGSVYTAVVNAYVPVVGNGSIYFKAANAVQNLELLDAGEVLEAVADVSANVVPNNASLISSYAMPDISRAVKVSSSPADGSTFTAPSDGIFCLYAVGNTDTDICQIGIYNGGNIHTAPFANTNSVTTFGAFTAYSPVSKGDTVMIYAYKVTFTWNGYTNLGLWFIPTKGGK